MTPPRYRLKLDFSQDLDVLEQQLQQNSRATPEQDARFEAFDATLSGEQQKAFRVVLTDKGSVEYAVAAGTMMDSLRNAGIIGGNIESQVRQRHDLNERMSLRLSVRDLKQQLARTEHRRYVPSPQEKAEWDYAEVYFQSQRNVVLTSNPKEIENTARVIEAYLEKCGGSAETTSVMGAAAVYPARKNALKHLELNGRVVIVGRHVQLQTRKDRTSKL